MDRRRELTLTPLIVIPVTTLTLIAVCVMMLPISWHNYLFPKSEDFVGFLLGMVATAVGSLVMVLFLRYSDHREDKVTVLLGVVLGLLAAGVTICLLLIMIILNARQRYEQIGSLQPLIGTSAG